MNVSDSLASRDVHHSLTYLNPHLNPPSAQDHAVNSYAKDFFHWLVTTRIGEWFFPKILLISRFCLVSPPSNHSQRRLNQKMAKFCGSQHLAETLSAITPGIVKQIIDSTATNKNVEGFNIYWRQEAHTMERLLLQLMSRFYVQVAEKVKQQNPSIKEISISDVIALVCKMIQEYLHQIKEQLEINRHISNPIIRQQELSKLFEPLIDSLLSLAFPKGAKSLPIRLPFGLLGLSSYLWNKFRNFCLTQFIEIYQQLQTSVHEPHKEALLRLNGGDSLISVAELASEKLAEALPTLFAGEPNPDRMSEPFRQNIVEGILALMSPKEASKESLKRYVEKQLAGIGENKSPALKAFWELIGSYAEPFLAYVFFHMSQNVKRGKTHNKDHDALVNIVVKFFSTCHAFTQANGIAINKRIAVLNLLQDSPINDKALQVIFGSFADDMLEMMGLEKADTFPVPEFLRNITYTRLKEMAPQFLLKEYVVFSISAVVRQTNSQNLDSLLLRRLVDNIVAKGHILTA